MFTNCSEIEDESTGVKEAGKVYLQQHPLLRGHDIWTREGFWDASLLSGLVQELDRRPPVLWDELSPSELVDTVNSVHNILFGQLGALTFNMREVGLSFDEVSIKKVVISYHIIVYSFTIIIYVARNAYNICLISLFILIFITVIKLIK